jgi:hypothetical protein
MRVSPVIPAAILVTVGVVQVWLARTVDLTAWKGGGFGMFSTLDDGPRRYVRIYLDSEGRSEEIEVPASLQDPAARLATLPSPSRLARFTEAVIAREHRQGRPVSRVRVEVWRQRVDPVTLGAHLILLRRYERHVAP